jgi:AcrR family transcriptional regulator
MSQDDAKRLLAAAQRVRAREGPGFPVAELARPAGISRATLYRRLAADRALAAEVERVRREGALSPRQEFLRAATALLAEKGLAALTMDAVAERAGFSTATLYRCFGDRDGLVREVVRGSLSAGPVLATLALDGPFEEVLVRFVEAMITRLREQPHLLRLILLGDREEMRELRKLRRDEERLSILLGELFERCGKRERLRSMKPERLVAALMGQVLGALVFQRMSGDDEAPDARTIVTLFLRGALRTEHEGGPTDERAE